MILPGDLFFSNFPSLIRLPILLVLSIYHILIEFDWRFHCCSGFCEVLLNHDIDDAVGVMVGHLEEVLLLDRLAAKTLGHGYST